MTRPVKQSDDHIDGKTCEVAEEHKRDDEWQEKEQHQLLHTLSHQLFFLLELHAGTAETVVVTEMMMRVLF